MIENLSEWLSETQSQAKQSGFETQVYGSVAGLNLPAYSCNGATGKPLIYLSSGMHGDEPAGPLAISELLKEGDLSKDYNWLIAPMLNPTGHAVGTRENANGMDLNRDYYRFRSVEAKSHAEWLNSHPVPDLMLSLHEDWETSGYYFYEINQTGEMPEISRELMTRLDSVMQREPMLDIDDHRVRERGWIYHEASADEFQSWPEAIFMAERGVPISLTMETPSSLDLRARIDLHKAFVKEAVNLFV